MVHLIEVIGFSSPKSDSNFPVKNDPDRRVNLLRCSKTNAQVCGHILDPLKAPPYVDKCRRTETRC